MRHHALDEAGRIKRGVGRIASPRGVYVERGIFDDAVDAAQKALKLAQTTQDKQLADGIQHRLSLFRNHQPYVEILPK